MSNKHFYALWVNYLPNSAPSNRMLAYLNAWSKMDVDVTVVITLPDRKYSKVPLYYNNVHFKYLWELIPIKCRLLHYVLYDYYVKNFVRGLSKGDNVYVYGQANTLPYLLERKDIRVFHEMTEHPAVIPLGVKFHTLKLENYLDSCRHLSGLFVITSGLMQYFTENGVEKDKIEIVNVIVDSKRFDKLQKQHTKKYIAYCGNASNNKDGVDQLIRAFAKIAPRYNDLYLYVIGKAPDNLEEDNNVNLAEQLGVKDKVIFTGIVSFDKMPQILKNASVLALARPDNKQARYGFPTKLGEYLLTGNPVVITDTGDISLFLKDKDSAMIAIPDNIDDFANKVSWVLDNPDKAAIIGKKGKKIAMESFNSEIEAKKIINCMF